MLNREDPEWFWIVRSDGQEGFIPSGFVYPADNILQNNTKPSAQSAYNSAMNQLNDARQLQNPVSAVDPIVANDANTCQTHNLQMATGIGHVNANIADQASMVINGGANTNSNTTNGQVQVSSSQQQQQSVIGGSEDLRYHGTELVMLYDYKVTYINSMFFFLHFFLIFRNEQIENAFHRLKPPTIYPYDAVIGFTLI